MPSLATVAFATAKRNIITDLKYKTDFLIQATWSLVNVLAFAFLGFAVGQGDSEYAPKYTMSLFFVASAAYWTLFSAPFEEASVALREETQRGTMGFLVTNDVNPFSIMLARYVSSAFKFLIVFLGAIFPVLFFISYQGKPMLPVSLSEFFLLLLLFLNTYLFVMACSILIGSLGLIFKNTQTISRIILYSLRIISTYFTPLAAFALFMPSLPRFMFYVPVTLGLEGMRQILILHTLQSPYDPYLLVIPISFLISLLLLLVSKIVVDKLTLKALRAGTLEFY